MALVDFVRRQFKNKNPLLIWLAILAIALVANYYSPGDSDYPAYSTKTIYVRN
jgi:hypothetical protein